MLTNLRWAIALLPLVFLAADKAGQQIEGLVVGVTDGDTITVLDSAKVQHKIRLASIDAPENAQRFGTQSRHALSAKIFHQTVKINVVDIDKYGRSVGDVSRVLREAPST